MTLSAVQQVEEPYGYSIISEEDYSSTICLAKGITQDLIINPVGLYDLDITQSNDREIILVDMKGVGDSNWDSYIRPITTGNNQVRFNDFSVVKKKSNSWYTIGSYKPGNVYTLKCDDNHVIRLCTNMTVTRALEVLNIDLEPICSNMSVLVSPADYEALTGLNRVYVDIRYPQLQSILTIINSVEDRCAEITATYDVATRATIDSAMSSLQDRLIAFKSDIDDSIDDLKSHTILSLTNIVNNLDAQINEAYSRISNTYSSYSTYLMTMYEKISGLINALPNPERLDRLEASLSSLASTMAANEQAISAYGTAIEAISTGGNDLLSTFVQASDVFSRSTEIIRDLIDQINNQPLSNLSNQLESLFSTKVSIIEGQINELLDGMKSSINALTTSIEDAINNTSNVASIDMRSLSDQITNLSKKVTDHSNNQTSYSKSQEIMSQANFVANIANIIMEVIKHGK